MAAFLNNLPFDIRNHVQKFVTPFLKYNVVLKQLNDLTVHTYVPNEEIDDPEEHHIYRVINSKWYRVEYVWEIASCTCCDSELWVTRYHTDINFGSQGEMSCIRSLV